MLKKSRKKSQKKFHCKSCLYTSSNKFDWVKHLLTTKHQNANYANQKSHTIFHCHHCKRNYKHASSFSRHKKACRLEEEIGGLKKILEEISLKQKQIEDNQKESNIKIENFSEKVDQKLDNIIIKGNQQGNTINSNNNNNNNISINVFLNEKCNNAINWKDFVDKMRVSMEDLMKTKQIGYAAGMTNIFIKNLEDLPTKERPIHCSDTKRLKFYVKDEDKWGKDGGKKMEEAIHKVSVKQIKTIKEWENAHPNFLENQILMQEWHKLILNTMGGSTDEKREKAKKEIIKNVGTHVVLKSAIENSNDI